MDLKNMIPGGAGEEQAPEQRLSKEEYAAMKKQQREEVWGFNLLCSLFACISHVKKARKISEAVQ